jgi:hypothetical protein
MFFSIGDMYHTTGDIMFIAVGNCVFVSIGDIVFVFIGDFMFVSVGNMLIFIGRNISFYRYIDIMLFSMGDTVFVFIGYIGDIMSVSMQDIMFGILSIQDIFVSIRYIMLVSIRDI